MFHRLQKEFLKIKGLLDEKRKECDYYKKETSKTQDRIAPRVKRIDNTKDSHNLEFLRKKLIEKGSELSKLQQKIKDKPLNKMLFLKEKAKQIRKSLGEIDLVKNFSPSLVKKEEFSPYRDDAKNNLKKIRSSSRGHARSFSEQTRPKPVKRVPSR